ncbi:MAG TPA: transporter substrate-binding domain-containing protein [Acetobacteraceae bacterium]|nr:transporter substrate-binding domain-containing protein [Acetobacteraceae bacterium]
MALWLPQRRDIISFAGVFGLLGAVYLLPPDTALQEVRAAGTLRVCLPPFYPPLVTGDLAAPGIDIDLLKAIAGELGVRLVPVMNPIMGRDFNPRAWRITRAQCEVLAGGVIGSPSTRSFLETTPAYAETGWAWISPHPGAAPEGRRIGVLVGVSGLNRVALAAWLRAAKAQVTVTLDATELVQGLKNGRFDVGITERLLAVELATPLGWNIGWMPAELGRYPVVLGLWKGDLTLKRAIVSVMRRMQHNGELAAITARYIPGGSALQDDARDGSLGRRE